jgi:very-short-patch-repair endonuclease
MVKHFTQRDAQLQGKLRTIARQMRHEPTPAENFLWQRLRGRRLCGYRFHRQYSIDRFIVDFYCPGAALIIEVDGEVHRQQVEADQERVQILKGLGYRVIRFTNTQVLKELDHVLWKIQDVLKGTPSPKSGFDDLGEGAGR